VQEIERDDHGEEIPAVHSDALSQTPVGAPSPAIRA